MSSHTSTLLQRLLLLHELKFATLTAMLTSLTDELLMQRYCDGDFLAFKELYARHSTALYRFIAWRSPRQEWVDEITQDCRTALHHARHRYQAEAAFRTYLFQIARNRLIDIVRQHQSQLDSDLDHANGVDEHQDVFDHIASISNDGMSPEDELIKKQESRELHAAIRALPQDQKEALVLQQFNGMSLDEIADISAVPVETIKSRIRYAMRKLRQQFVVGKNAQQELV